MSESNIQHVGIKDFISLAGELIEQDIKVQKHLYWLSLCGVDSSPMNLELHKTIFKLMGIKNTDIIEEAKEWYFKTMEQSFSIDVFNNPKVLADISTEILIGLERYKLKEFASIRKKRIESSVNRSL